MWGKIARYPLPFERGCRGISIVDFFHGYLVVSGNEYMPTDRSGQQLFHLGLGQDMGA